ncbi:MAG: type II toxin-antitoxin system RelE/ParE family toxin [Rubrivivax sp.]|nr:type II toxin-antitoxin system RelE/ParE family toxin [Rubrivivax sp.]
MKPATLRPAAEQDVLDLTHWYAEQGEPGLAERFFDEARAALREVEGMPGMGSLRLGELAGFPGLRSWAVRHFPVRWFYVEDAESLDVVRLLGERQNVAALLRPDQADPAT